MYSAASSVPFWESAQAACLLASDGEILYQKNASAQLPMASTTKIMTALVVLETLPLSTVVSVSKEAIEVEGSSAYLLENELLTVEDLLYALLLQSANDSAVALALAVSPDLESFVEKMNQKAFDLGLSGTRFANPHGLDHADHYTTATDLARLSMIALQREDFRTITSTKTYTCTSDKGISRTFTNHNRLLFSYDGCIGVKTGYTQRSGRCLVSAAEKDELTLVFVTLNDPSDWKDHARALDYGFSAYSRVTLAVSGQYCYLVPVVSGEKSILLCSNDSGLELWVKTGSDIEMSVELPRFGYAPFNCGDVIGKLVFYSGNKCIAQLPLSVTEGVEAEKDRRTWWKKIADWIKEFLTDLLGS
jgi:D-alanyl-D-alanine carboxypeptidase